MQCLFANLPVLVMSDIFSENCLIYPHKAINETNMTDTTPFTTVPTPIIPSVSTRALISSTSTNSSIASVGANAPVNSTLMNSTISPTTAVNNTTVTTYTTEASIPNTTSTMTTIASLTSTITRNVSDTTKTSTPNTTSTITTSPTTTAMINNTTDTTKTSIPNTTPAITTITTNTSPTTTAIITNITNTTKTSTPNTTYTTTTTVGPTTTAIIKNTTTTSGIPSKTAGTTNSTVNTTSTVANTTNVTNVIKTNKTITTTTTTTTTATPTNLIDDISTSATLPSFEDDTGPKSVKLPVPLYELPNENLLGGLSQFDNKLIESTSTYDDLNNTEKVLFTSLNGTLPYGSLTTPGIQQKKRSVYIDSNENQSCICLLNDTNRERYYFRQCLLDANECDYGLSLSIWLQFTTEILYTKEFIISTAPENAKGFSLSIINGMLQFKLRSVDTQWIISAPITKTLHQWHNIGVAWGKSTQSIKLVINGNTVAMKNNYEGVNYPGTNSTPTSIWIGCSVGSDGQTITSSINPGIKVATVALWYWPIQLNELFGGDQEYYLLTHEFVTNPPVSQPIQPNYADYTNEVEELTPTDEISQILNPVYLIADYYNPLLQLPANYTQDDIILISDRSKQKTAYYLSNAESCYELELFNMLTCPGNVHLCTQGLSIGVWLNVPNSLNTTLDILDILELVNGTSVSVYNNYINIFINSMRGLLVFRVYNVIPRDIWFNLGVSISNFINPTVDVYFNGITMVVEQVMPPTTTPLKRMDKCSNGLILGSSKSGKSTTGIAYSDFILWYRWLYSFESHLFVGYTSAQQANLHNSSYYWTPDPYIAYDSDVQIQVRQKYNYFQPENDYSLTGIPGYSLASIYSSKFVTFRFNQDDYENKSKVPVFEMKPQQYMMLGQRKSSEVISTNLVWNSECLIEPSLTACNAHGFSLSMWIKLLSVSQNRLRFYLNSGDSGTSSSTMSYYRGISIFTDTSLIGVSISQFSLTWQLILDSSSYKVGQWINIGILWRGDVGLTLLLDGVNYGSMLSNGQKVYKPRKSPPYLILGRFNTDQKTTWLSPSDADDAAKEANNNQPQWEMSHYALGDIAYFNRLLSHKEYNEQIGLLNIPYLRDVIGNVWFGKHMISPPLSQIIKAVSRNISKPGPIFNSSLSNSVLLLKNPEVVQLTGGGSLRLGIFEPNTCPFNLQNCEKGLSIGGWYRFGGYFTKPNENQIEPIILFTGLGGNYGLTLSYNGALLGGWLQYEIKLTNDTIIQYYWKCIIHNLQIGLNQKNMQWIHLSLIWTGLSTTIDDVNTLQLLINGLIMIKCNQNTPISDLFYQQWIEYAINKAKNLFIETNTHNQSYLLVSSNINNTTYQQITFSIALLVLQRKYLILTNLMNLIGIEYYEILELLYSSFYWQISGYLNQLTPYRIQLMNAHYARDQYDSPMGALCTEGNHDSYIILNGDKIMHNSEITNLYESCLYDPSTCKRYAISLRFNLLQLPNNNNNNFVYEILRTTPIGSTINTVGLLMYLSLDQSRLIVEIRSQIITSRNSIKFNTIQQLEKWINIQIFYYQDRPLTIHIDGNLISSIENGTYTHEINAKLSNEMRLKQNLIIGRGLKMCISSVTLYDMSSDSDFNLLVNNTNTKICYTNMDMFEALDGTITDYNNRSNSALQLMNSTKILSFSKISCFHNPDICSINGMTMSIWIMINGFVNEAGEMLTMKNNENLTAVILSTGPPQNVGILIQVKGQFQNDKLTLSLITSIYTQHYLWSVDSNNALKLGQWTNIAFSWFSKPEENTGSLDVYIDGIRKHSSTMPTPMSNMNVEISDTSKILIGSAFYNTTNYTKNPNKAPNIIRMTNLANRLTSPSEFLKLLQISTELLKNYNTHQTTDKNISSLNNNSNINDVSNLISSIMSIIDLWLKSLQNSLTLNTSFLTKSNKEIWLAQFKIKVNSNKNQQNVTLNKIVSILTILNENNANSLIGDISLDQFSISAQQQQQQNYVNDKQNKLPNNDTEQLQIDRIFYIVSPIYSVEYYAGNQLDTIITNSNNNNNDTIQLSFSIPLLHFNKYQSVYYFESTWRMKWKAYKAEQYHEDELANEIRCVYLNNQFQINGKWDTNGCQIVKAEISQVQCVCNHLSVFAVAMESENASYRSIPIWKVWGLQTESQCSMIIGIIIYGGNGLSLVCSLLFLITLVIVRKTTNIQDVYLTRIGLCLCQIGFHATLFIEPLMNTYQIPCQAIGVSLNLFTILVSSWLTNEAFSLFKSFVLGKLKLTYCWAWTMGIVLPLALTLIPTITSKFSSQGGDLFCLPSRESLEFWIMFGSVFAYTVVSIMVCLTLTCNVETPAFLPPKLLDRLLTRVKNLNSLVIYYTLSWSLFVLVIKVTIPHVVFIAFALVSLQGTWSFITYGLQDRELFKTCLRRKRKQQDIVEGTGILPKNLLIINREKDAFRMSNKANNSHQDNITVVSLQKKDSTNDTQILKRK
ncbi:hypothetical protein MN116_001869 [Schistosoma mekongi]|uniref:GAIN-B domain-containing protein n=1 Tax=Schistosoma mekongi TaxID=38744 RepID=A0AAE2D838_SCHME|nr:hypothetical protein MN116_001869 [Schistosoma mekongi]